MGTLLSASLSFLCFLTLAPLKPPNPGMGHENWISFWWHKECCYTSFMCQFPYLLILSLIHNIHLGLIVEHTSSDQPCQIINFFPIIEQVICEPMVTPLAGHPEGFHLAHCT